MKKVKEKNRSPRKKRQSGFTVPDDVQYIYNRLHGINVKEKKERLPLKKRQSGFTAPDDIQEIQNRIDCIDITPPPLSAMIVLGTASEEAFFQNYTVEIKDESLLLELVRRFRTRPLSSSVVKELEPLMKSSGATGLYETLLEGKYEFNYFLLPRWLYFRSMRQKLGDSALTLDLDESDLDYDSDYDSTPCDSGLVVESAIRRQSGLSFNELLMY